MLVDLPFLPPRNIKPRKSGLSMVMDKGLSLREAEDLVSVAHHLIDYIKLGFGTSLFTNNVAEKIKCYQSAGIKVYLGGTLFEAFIIRNKFEDYKKLLNKLNLDTVEVSDGSMDLDHVLKCDFINKLSKEYTVISEVGSKEAGKIISPERWLNMMLNELAAGSIKVIAEARESGTVGIYDADGKANIDLIETILSKV
jgi:phosphosulfolactate synthase